MMFLGFVYFRTRIFLWGTNPIMALGETIWIGVVRRASARVYRPHSSRRQDEEMIKSHGTVCVCVCEIFVPPFDHPQHFISGVPLPLPAHNLKTRAKLLLPTFYTYGLYPNCYVTTAFLTFIFITIRRETFSVHSTVT